MPNGAPEPTSGEGVPTDGRGRSTGQITSRKTWRGRLPDAGTAAPESRGHLGTPQSQRYDRARDAVNGNPRGTRSDHRGYNAFQCPPFEFRPAMPRKPA
ncbi:hypothetical protein GCM10027445_69160 [Amycolatopsis endophytica]